VAVFVDDIFQFWTSIFVFYASLSLTKVYILTTQCQTVTKYLVVCVQSLLMTSILANLECRPVLVLSIL